MALTAIETERFLNSVRVSDIMQTGRTLITVPLDGTVGQTLKILAENGISSAPLMDPDTKKLVGFIDVLDITVFVVSCFLEEKTFEIIGDVGEMISQREYVHQAVEPRFRMKVGDLIDISQDDPFVPVPKDITVASLINGAFRHAIHRVTVMDNELLVGMVSQSDVIQMLSQNLDAIPHLANMRLNELLHGVDISPLVYVYENEPLIRAFAKILKHDVTGIAVVDSHTHKLLGNISASDLKGVTEDNFFKLEIPVDELLQDNIYRLPPQMVTMDATLGEVILKIASSKVHRIYIVDTELRPLHVLTLTNILTIIGRSFPPKLM